MSRASRIFVLGDALGSYRARALIEFLYSSDSYACWYYSNRYFSNGNGTLYQIGLTLLKQVVRGIALVNLALCDRVYVLPGMALRTPEFYLIKVLKKRVIVDFYVSMYDTYVLDRKTTRADTRSATRMMRHDRRLVDVAETVVFLNRAERDYYLAVIGRPGAVARSVCSPLATDTRSRAVLPFANGRCEVITLCWWGTYIPLHGLEQILGCAAALKASEVRFRLYLFGTSDDLSRPYKKLITEYRLDDFVVIDNQKRFSDFSLEDFLVANCDVAFGNFGDSKKAKTVLVNKVIEAASMGIPVISAKTEAMAEFFQDRVDIVYSDSTSDGIASGIVELIKNRHLIAEIGSGAYSTYITYFSKRAYTFRILDLLR